VPRRGIERFARSVYVFPRAMTWIDIQLNA